MHIDYIFHIPIPCSSIVIGWTKSGVGFGQVIIGEQKKTCDGEIVGWGINSEYMGEEHVKEVLMALVDQAEFIM